MSHTNNKGMPAYPTIPLSIAIINARLPSPHCLGAATTPIKRRPHTTKLHHHNQNTHKQDGSTHRGATFDGVTPPRACTQP